MQEPREQHRWANLGEDDAASGRHAYGHNEPAAMFSLLVRHLRSTGVRTCDGKDLEETLKKRPRELAIAFFTYQAQWHATVQAARLVTGREGGEQPMVRVPVELGVLPGDDAKRSKAKCRAINRMPLSTFVHYCFDHGLGAPFPSNCQLDLLIRFAERGPFAACVELRASTGLSCLSSRTSRRSQSGRSEDFRR